ncbi:MAG: cob(I)yrinic acid a,c-diamide adenosyltransferase [Candidatus Sulfotelmatobacter sp.]
MQVRPRARKTITLDTCSRRDLRSLPADRDLLAPDTHGWMQEFHGKTVLLLDSSQTRYQGERQPCSSRITLPAMMADVRRGLIIVNTGPGKGKTTAAMGTALRAVGQGMRVLMLQFLKGSWHYGELDAVKAFGDKFVMKQMGRGFVKVGAEKPDPEDVKMVEEAWAEGEKAIQSGEWDLVILDEINYAISYGMLDPAKVVESLQKKPEMVHVILTGRNAHPTIVEAADTVTEMRQVKHAYEKGVMAQRGIEY